MVGPRGLVFYPRALCRHPQLQRTSAQPSPQLVQQGIRIMGTRANPANHHTRFKGRGLGTRHKQPPLSVLVHWRVDQYVRAKPSKSDWLRSAIFEKIEREGWQLQDDELVPMEMPKAAGM